MAGDCDHLFADVDPDDLTGRAEIVGETEHRVAQSASDIDQTLTGRESQTVAFPSPQLDRRLPESHHIHRVDEERHVGRRFDDVVPQREVVLRRHGRTVGLRPRTHLVA